MYSTFAQEPEAAPAIIGGRPADPESWPWMASLQFQVNPENDPAVWEHVCGATRLGPVHLITAAHCVDSM